MEGGQEMEMEMVTANDIAGFSPLLTGASHFLTMLHVVQNSTAFYLFIYLFYVLPVE